MKHGVTLHVSSSPFLPLLLLLAPTTCRPDIVLFSKKLRRVLWLELTVCSRDRIRQSREKLSRYRHLKQECIKNGWEVEALVAEVEVRGAVSSSLDGWHEHLAVVRKNSAN